MRKMLLAGVAALLMTLPVGGASAQPWATEGQKAAGRAALGLANGGRFPQADAAALGADPLVRKIVTWLRLAQRGQATSGELVAWLAENPDWPLPETMARRAEEALATDPDDSRALAHFERVPNRTLDGAQRHADALSRAGRAGEAAAVLRNAWAAGFGDAAAEYTFAERNAAALTAEDRWRRFDRAFLARDTAAAMRAAGFVDPARRAVADARLAIASDRAEPVAASDDLGILAASAGALRRRGADAQAAAVWAAAAPLQRDLTPDAARGIWTERQVLVRRLLRAGEDRLAYQVAAAHGQPGPSEARQEAEFLAGFVALRRLNEPATAARHFARVGEGSSSVITRARALHWEARATTDASRARALHEGAAAWPTAFYGQLSALALGETTAQLSARIRATVPQQPSAEATRLFPERELVQAAVALYDLGDARRARIFLLRLEELSPDAADRVLIARLGNAMGRPDHAVWVSRRAGVDGVMLLPEGWPAPYPMAPDILEPAIANAITRQESNFEADVVSSANAQGLMQLLPATAAATARAMGIPHQVGWLRTDPAHNIRLGSRYLADQLARFGGTSRSLRRRTTRGRRGRRNGPR
ncbi:transglycosylase SLT domain-containing protein [Roseomonas sp. CCTCC AB2023176]|uniref:transglycosylase SLT domain-containing protein n=1 Tax=Roseomonas sp. CCTCC AB2023176 TaxID=3342640 RepID=UPI0035DAAD4E